METFPYVTEVTGCGRDCDGFRQIASVAIARGIFADVMSVFPDEDSPAKLQYVMQEEYGTTAYCSDVSGRYPARDIDNYGFSENDLIAIVPAKYMPEYKNGTGGFLIRRR